MNTQSYVRRKTGNTTEYGRIEELDPSRNRARVRWIGRILSDGQLAPFPRRSGVGGAMSGIQKRTWIRQSNLVEVQEAQP